MLDFFGTPWDQLTVEVVTAFLADAGEEGLTWEAKGRTPPHRNTIRNAACGFANADGGFLIIGAEPNADGGWSLDGVTFGHDEPGTWLSSVVASGLNPLPPFDVKVFERDDGRKAAVLAVGRVAVPPCVTATGAVFQRVTGQTLPVVDQRVLSELFTRGRTARQQAETLALRASERALREPGRQPPDQALFSIALCPIQGTTDKAAVMFTFRFAELLQQLVERRMQVHPGLRYSAHVELAQDHIRASPAHPELGESWSLVVQWDGAVSAVFATGSDELYIHELLARVGQGWKVLVDAALAAGGSGESHLVVRVNAEHPAVAAHRGAHPKHPAQRWTELREPTEGEVGTLNRELERGFGQQHVWEPDPDDDA